MSEEELRATFRAAIEQVRRDYQELRERVAAGEAQLKFLWQFIIWGGAVMTALIIGWIKLAGQ